ncbi:NAD(P)H-dependent oxidoreductase [Phenylobacterium sp.]|uniref:NADPH-dependent FMN reductase n=1 Tax=Phenylobacterium sp. TaxID=1871053 RepID=UPI0025F2641F|nr:NAD(P)H-dependent oxidoreductase [Phenylobacterium sp.]
MLVIAGSVRPKRICLDVAAWVAAAARDVLSNQVEVIDLKDWALPMDGEPGLPHRGDYRLEATRAWSRKVGAAQGMVFVTPQYNWGYPAPLKNALDHLYTEWAGKPAVIVAYGGHGGDRCARQLREVLTGLHMRPMRTTLRLPLRRDLIEADLASIDAAVEFAPQERRLRRALGQLGRCLPGPG